LLTALILSAADAGNTLWAYPTPRNRPRQLVVPTVYQERNLWKVMQDTVRSWQVLANPIPHADWQDSSSSTPGIYRFQGRMKALELIPNGEHFSAVIMTIPRPNQAFWTLSALWTGWIWGKEAASPIRKVLSRQRYDWNWHTNALMGIFEELNTSAFANTKLWGLVAENEPMFLLSTLLAAGAAGLRLQTYAQSIDDELAQCAWESKSDSIIMTKPDLNNQAAREVINFYLHEKGEPASYEQVHAAAVTGLAQKDKLVVQTFEDNRNQFASETQKWIEIPFQDQDFLERVSGGAVSLESGQWWLSKDQNTKPALIDRLEKCIFEYLLKVQITTAQEVKQMAFQAFPGLLTPTDSELLNCLESYAELVDKAEHRWQLRETEIPFHRQQDLQDVENSLKHIAHRLNYHASGSKPMVWHDPKEPTVKYCFYILISAEISETLRYPELLSQINFLVLPGSRSNLLAFKKQRNPVFGSLVDERFQVVKFRLIRDLEANPLLNRELFIEQIRVDPPEYRTSQLALF
ncbi:MAG: hypothetical protein ACK2TV_13655, partial [Anaerolineales bacterium]